MPPGLPPGFQRGTHTEPGDLQPVPAGKLEYHSRKIEVAIVPAALVMEGQRKAAAHMTTFQMRDRPGIVLRSGERFIKGLTHPEMTSDHAHAVAVDGAKLEPFREQLLPGIESL